MHEGEQIDFVQQRRLVKCFMYISAYYFSQVTLVRPRDKFENVFRHYLIEDRGVNGSPSYVDYLCYLHKEIRSLLS